MNEIQASLGISQLKKIDIFVKNRNLIADKYNQELVNLPLKLPPIDKKILSSYHLYIILMKNVDNQKKLYNYLIKRKIFVNLHYIPIYRHSFYKSLGFKKGYCVDAEKYFKSAITLPIFPHLKKNQQNYIIKSIKNFFN